MTKFVTDMDQVELKDYFDSACRYFYKNPDQSKYGIRVGSR
mgnify:CR=1 FL=1